MKRVMAYLRMMFFNNGLFSIIPLAFLIVAILYIYCIELFFLRCTDPDFAYLFNGITLAHLRPNLYTIGHPGTPIHCIIAPVAWVVHLFRPGSLWDDVLLHPEIYIKATLYTANAINAVFLFLVGKCVYRYTREISTALVLQLTPFAFLMTMEVSYRLMPELIMLSIVSMWIIMLTKIIHQPEPERNYHRYAILFGLLFGFSLADKLTFVPFFFIPLFILPKWKIKLKYTLVSVAGFFVFAFPVLFDVDRFFNFSAVILSHKGIYGKGGRGFIDPATFMANMKAMISSTWQIIIPLMLLFILALLYLIKRRKTDMIFSLAAGIIAMVVLMFILTAKHYAFYYLTPVLHMTIFIAYTVTLVLRILYPAEWVRKFSRAALIVFGLFLCVIVAPKAHMQIKDLWEGSRRCDASYRELAPFITTSPKIICPYYYGCSSIEYSLTFGLQESGMYGRNYLNDVVNNLYPATYMFYDWNGHFYNGPFDIRPSEFIEPNVDYTLYLADYSEEKLQKFIDALQSDTVKYQYQLNEIHRVESTREFVYQLRIHGHADSVSLPLMHKPD